MRSAYEPELAVVRPRVVVVAGASAMLLEEEVGALLATGEPRHVLLIGPTGIGKRTAMRHLAAVFADEPDLQLLGPRDPVPASARVVVQIATAAIDDPSGAQWTLAPWSDDDCFDYLLAEHPLATTLAFAAWRHPAPIPDLRRWPALTRAVLDHLAHVAATAPIDTAHDALIGLAFVLANQLGNRRAAARDFALRSFMPPHARPDPTESVPAIQWQEPALLRCLTVRALLAAEELLRRSADGDVAPFAPRAWTEPLCATIAHLLHADPTLMHRLVAHAAKPPRRPALLMSLLSVAIPGFRPPVARLRHLVGARLVGADFSGCSLLRADLEAVMLRDAKLEGADLREARAARRLGDGLRGANLRADAADFTDASLRGAQLQGARLTGATLLRADLTRAQLQGANLLGARLTGCRFADTDLSSAHLGDADLAHTDLRGANLQGADLEGTRLFAAQLAGMDLGAIRAAGADWTHADCTGARLAGADLRRAVFTGAMLADVDLEGADLRDADLRGATFQLGGSRSGRVGSEIAGEGSRTGFYSDADDEVHFTAPEDLRKANLRDCDLRGARVDSVDLHLVDLRGARLDPPQRDHARRCKAILDRSTP